MSAAPALQSTAAPAALKPDGRGPGTRTSAGPVAQIFGWLLAGEVMFTLLDVLEPKLLPVLLKIHGATDRQIGIIVGTINAALQMLLMAPIGYYSDRLRTRWGRRIPLLFLALPIAAVFLALTPFAPDVAERALRVPWLSNLLRSLPVAPVIVCFALLVFFFRAAQTVVNAMFFGLVRDVVPDSHMGRFLALFRLAGAASTFVVTFWLLRNAETHSKPIFVSVAVLSLLVLGTMCWFVREPVYPSENIGLPHSASHRDRTGAVWRAARTFLRESYTHPVYLWTYAVRICLYGALFGVSGFVVFFPKQELGLTLETSAQLLALPSLLWLALAYPVGRLIDSWGAMRVLWHGLAVTSVSYALSFFVVIGPKTFLLLSTVSGLGFWTVMLAQLKMTQEIFHPLRYSQLAGANTMLQGLAIAVVISPAVGWTLDALRDWRFVWELPVIGELTGGPYRCVNLMMALLYALAWVGVVRVRHHWKALGGPGRYAPPL